MARNRMISPEFWLDEDVAKMSSLARLLYIGLWGICDDNYATFPNRPEWIKAQVFPYEEVDMVILLDELKKSEKIIQFDSDGKSFWFIKNFFKHQRVDKPSKPKYPKFPEYDYENLRGLSDYSPTTPTKEKRSKVKISKDKIREDKEALLSHWNELKTIVHKSLSKEADKEIDKALDVYSLEEIKSMMTVYATVLNEEKYWWSHKWNLYEFLKRGLKKFEGKKPEDYLKDTRSSFDKKVEIKKI